MHDDDIKKDPFEEYEKIKPSTKEELFYTWGTAIGLQKVDGLETSSYLKETVVRNLNGDITLNQAREIIESYYTEDRKRENPKEAEADIVSTRIAELIDNKGFSFSVQEYLNIHKYLFEGVYKFAGKIRDYNISKKEWVLDNDSVTYGSSYNLLETLEYDFNEEKNFNYTKLTNSYDKVHRLAIFASRIWQVHVFGEGNTRTTAVFLIKYLRSKGYNVSNDLFKQNSWYFRNALVRANYTNEKKGISETTEYLEFFFRNLLLGEDNELKNRYMHIGFVKGQKIIDNPIERLKEIYIFKMQGAKFLQKTINHTLSLFNEFGLTKVFGRNDVVNVLDITITPATNYLKKLLELGIIEPIKGFGKGKYKFNDSLK